MKNVIILVCSIFMICTISCKKDKTIFNYTINGINLADENNMPIGKIGNPNDVITEDENIQLTVYPKPCTNSLHVNIENKSGSNKDFEINIYAAEMINTSLEMPSSIITGSGQIPIENANMGSESQFNYSSTIPANENKITAIEISKLPRGFYILSVKIGDAISLKEYKDNIWVYRP